MRPTAAATPDGTAQVDERFEAAMAGLYEAAQGGLVPAHDKLVALAHEGVAAAQFRLGQLLYQPGPALQRANSLPQALDWWGRASVQGYGRASLALANVHDQGEGGLATDPVRALHYYELAIVQGWVNPTSQTRLARALVRRGRSGDCTRILSLLHSAAATGFAEAVHLLTQDAAVQALCRT